MQPWRFDVDRARGRLRAGASVDAATSADVDLPAAPGGLMGLTGLSARDL